MHWQSAIHIISEQKQDADDKIKQAEVLIIIGGGKESVELKDSGNGTDGTK